MSGIWMMAAVGVIVILRFFLDQKEINRLRITHSLTQMQARGIFRSEIYNTMAANRVTSLIFLAAIGAAVYLFLNTVGEAKILMPILTIILGMEIGRYLTRNAADAAIRERISALNASTTPNSEGSDTP